MPKPENQRFHYYAVGDMMVLHDVTFNALGKAVTAAEAARKQEFRSQIDLGVRAAAALVGVIGALIGLVSVLRKQ
ncbi:MAG: hypothetical protein ACJ74Z_03110 [Bryobacteraceae bacterium]